MPGSATSNTAFRRPDRARRWPDAVAPALTALAVALLPSAAGPKPVEATPLAEAAAGAAHVLVAEFAGDALGALQPGARLSARHPGDYWEEFSILWVVRGGEQGLDPGRRVRLAVQSNSCLESPTGHFARARGRGTVEFRDEPRGVRVVVSPRYTRGVRVLLLLDAGRRHHGWFASPALLTPEVERAVPGIATAARLSESDPFGAPPRGTSPNCGPERRARLDVRLASAADFVALMKTLDPAHGFAPADLVGYAEHGRVDWDRVLAAVETGRIGSRTIYTLVYHTKRGPQPCGPYNLRVTGDGHLSMYGCCGE